MKKLNIVNNVLLFVILILGIFTLIKVNFSRKNFYDLNNDEQVDSLDLLILRKYLIEKNK